MIYLDNAAMMKPRPEVVNAVYEVMTEKWQNPSSVYAKDVRQEIEDARKAVAKLINAKPSEIHFTSGASESASILLNSLAFNDVDYRIYVTEAEHPAVNAWAETLRLDTLAVDVHGVVFPCDIPLNNGYEEQNVLFIICANNEVGTIQPMRSFGKTCRERNFLFATDLTQAFGHIPIDVEEMNIDFAFGSGQKIGGLSGCGFLYVRSGLEDKIDALVLGGKQDRYKSGTENITGIVALGVASECAYHELKNGSSDYVTELRDYMIRKILSEIPDTILIGHPTSRLPNNVNIGFGGKDSESIVQYLALYDICASAGSACHTKSVEPSHVLKAMRLSNKYINGSVRFTLSVDNTKEEIDEVVKVLKQYYESEED